MRRNYGLLALFFARGSETAVQPRTRGSATRIGSATRAERMIAAVLWCWTASAGPRRRKRETWTAVINDTNLYCCVQVEVLPATACT